MASLETIKQKQEAAIGGLPIEEAQLALECLCNCAPGSIGPEGLFFISYNDQALLRVVGGIRSGKIYWDPKKGLWHNPSKPSGCLASILRVF